MCQHLSVDVPAPRQNPFVVQLTSVIQRRALSRTCKWLRGALVEAHSGCKALAGRHPKTASYSRIHTPGLHAKLLQKCRTNCCSWLNYRCNWPPPPRLHTCMSIAGTPSTNTVWKDWEMACRKKRGVGMPAVGPLGQALWVPARAAEAGLHVS